MIERSELDGELASLERQKAETAKQHDETGRMLVRIDGALAMVRHMIDKCSDKAIKAQAEHAAKAAEAGGEQPPA